MLWMQHFLEELGLKQDKYVLHCDSHIDIHLGKNIAYHSKIKHIGVQYHSIFQLLDDGLLQLEKKCIEENPTSMLKKMLPRDKQELYRILVGVIQR